MGADTIARAANRLPMVPRRRPAALKAESRRFWIGVTCAAVLHAALIIGIARSSDRRVGEPEGSSSGISVELVDAADLLSRSTVQSPSDPSPAGPGSVAPPPPQPAAVPSPPRAVEPQTAAAPPIEVERPSPLSPPAPTVKEKTPPPAKAKPKPPPEPSPPLQLEFPDAMIAPSGHSAAVMRPPGVTRSGENDDFGRGVIRALRQTMPAPSGILGRVTIRLFLSETGNLADLRLIRSAGDPILDQNVMFAVKQASFPIPPAGATVPDRTFLVTYVYH
jgi:periplasmic protein TonB